MSETFVLEVDSLDLEGRGVARREGKVVFVEGALPRERVRAERLRAKPSYETARTVAVLRASSQRVAPRCPHFGLHAGACGGCSMQHVEARVQVAIKQRALEDSLWHIGKLRAEGILRPIVGPAWHYRQRARLAVRDVEKKGGVLVGFHERASSYVADMRECHVLPERVAALLVPLRELVGALTLRKRLPQIELAVAGDAVVLVLRVLQPPTKEDLKRLRRFAETYAVALWLQPGGPETARPMDAATVPALRLDLPEFGVVLSFAPTDFTQVNHRINEVLVRCAVRLLAPGPGDRVLDFFSGLGNFTLPLATRAERVLGIEGSPGLVQRARAAAADNRLAARADFEVGDLFAWTADDWRRCEAKLERIDRVLIDPPREGALAVARTLAAVERKPLRAVYVSCNPATLARDCAVLVHEGGWKLRAAGVVNMFPHTAHVESIAVLEPDSDGNARRPASAC
ncbi:MAG: 23S rRNA (uracil(1939)-C(5))-methyltransferase RlmD [Betaproteobacteria bacterium]|nr:MAG: 23S rRNA (uracil(1939)-C(5))-methyltransferase RlmD [Betaproteobacteria bacterium]